MTASWMVRSFAGTLFAVCAAVFALPGCGSSPTKPEKKEDKKDDTKPKTDTKPDSNVKQPETPPKTTLGDIEKSADQFQTAFLRDLLTGNVKAEMLSKEFIKVIGKPVKLPSDKEKGYSEDNALSWLKRVGTPDLQILPAMYQKQAGDVVYIRGLIGGQRLGKEANKSGSYSLRLVKESGAWKVDWLSLSSAELVSASPPATPDGAAQEFAVVSFVESVADLNGMPKEYHERTPLIAAALTPPLRMAWGPPFEQDKADGLDFNPDILHRAATAIGGGTSKFSVSRIGESSDYKVELTKPAGKKIYTVKLVKGRPNEWLVSEVTEQKG